MICFATIFVAKPAVVDTNALVAVAQLIVIPVTIRGVIEVQPVVGSFRR